jgi:hypothetical protein
MEINDGYCFTHALHYTFYCYFEVYSNLENKIFIVGLKEAMLQKFYNCNEINSMINSELELKCRFFSN